jgi:hypothetical protein
VELFHVERKDNIVSSISVQYVPTRFQRVAVIFKVFASKRKIKGLENDDDPLKPFWYLLNWYIDLLFRLFIIQFTLAGIWETLVSDRTHYGSIYDLKNDLN